MTYSESLTLKKLLSRCHAWAYELRTQLNQIGQPLEPIEGHIKDIEKTVSMLVNSASDTQCNKVSDRNELQEEMCHLTHALHDVRVELVRATERLRSISDAPTKDDLCQTEKNITMKISELQGNLQEVKNSSLKAFSEIRSRIDALDSKITELTTELADATVPSDAQATLGDLKTIARQLDDIVPDTTELPPPTIPPTEPAARRR